MSVLNCIAIDDEPFALEIIADDLKKFNNVKLLGKFTDSNAAKLFLENNLIDLIFLDIQMPGTLGTQFIQSIEKPPMVIFTTAYSHYAVEGFELKAIDYLMKPISFARLETAIQKAEEQFILRENLKPKAENPSITIFSEYNKINIFHENILYIEGLKDYVKIFVNDKPKPFLTRSNMKGIEQKLNSEAFIRIHNSIIVHLPKVTSYNKTKIFIEKTELPIGQKYAEMVANKLTH
ncbi:MAG: response regulator transcription factor [Bacteroidota bacterium]